jgi:hypothetical protein
MARTRLRSIFTGDTTIRTFGTGAFEREFPSSQTSISQPTCKPDEDRRISPSLPDIRHRPRNVSKMREPRRGRHAMATFWRLAGLWSDTDTGSCDAEEEGTSFMVDDLIVVRSTACAFTDPVIAAGRLALLRFSVRKDETQSEKCSGSLGEPGELSLIRVCTLSDSGH